MATDVAQSNASDTKTTEEDDAWLYGDEKKGDGDKVNGEPEATVSVVSAPSDEPVKKDDREEGEMSGEEEAQDKGDDDDDDSDDDVQVTIGDIQTFPLNEPRNLFKPGGGYQKPAAISNKVTTVGGTSKGPDMDTPGTINGVSQMDFDFNSLDDKPWRLPGADITDYFNYGFNEETWVQYQEKQKLLRAGNPTGNVTRVYLHHSSSMQKKDHYMHPPGTETPQTVQVIGARKTTPVQQRRLSGTINVIGSTARDSRRPEMGDPIPVAGGHKVFSTPPPGMTSHPPPGMPPMPDFALPPPGMPPPNLPPPGTITAIPPNIPPPGFPPEFDPFSYPPPGQAPISHYEDRAYSAPYSTSYPGQHTWQGSRPEEFNRWNEYPRDRDRSPGARSDSEFSSSGSEKDMRFRETRTVRYTDRERDSYSSRGRDRERESYRERSRERERSSRDHHHRDERDKHRSSSSRRKRDEEDSKHSKHKKSKKSKKDKDGEYDSSATGQESKPE